MVAALRRWCLSSHLLSSSLDGLLCLFLVARLSRTSELDLGGDRSRCSLAKDARLQRQNTLRQAAKTICYKTRRVCSIGTAQPAIGSCRVLAKRIEQKRRVRRGKSARLRYLRVHGQQRQGINLGEANKGSRPVSGVGGRESRKNCGRHMTQGKGRVIR